MRPFLILSVALVVGTLATLAVRQIRPQRFLAQRLTSELPYVADDELQVHLQQFNALGDDGLSSLVAALHHSRPAVNEMAEAVLRERLDRWQELSAVESSGKVASLARLLAQNQPHRAPRHCEAAETTSKHDFVVADRSHSD